MKYSYITRDGKVLGICQRGKLADIQAREQGNLYDDCTEQQAIEQVANRTGGCWYITPCASDWRIATTDSNGTITSVKKGKK